MSASPFRTGACRALTLALLAATLAGCNALTRLEQVGAEPPQSEIQNPARMTGSQPLEMPMPTPKAGADERHANSLWSPGSRAFFKDQRASEIGDILTVVINIDDSAQLSNETTRSRNAGENASLGSFLGLEGQLDRVLPDEVDPNSLVDAESDSVHSGNGEVDRTEEINLRVATMVTQVLPNGNLVIAGRQEVRVNYENRILQLTGVIRPEDIRSTNEISHEDIAEARIAYGGQGQLSDVQQPRYGQQIYDILFPF
jgi:flagellar L-ring protein precursor FlgH